MEFYDHFIYGSAAALVFPKLFFPQADPLTATLLSLASYGVAFVARPVGAAVFGHYGDRMGRKAILMITLLMMGFATFMIGLLPTYAPSARSRRSCWSCCASSRAWRSAANGAAPHHGERVRPRRRRRGLLGASSSSRRRSACCWRTAFSRW